jgi:hypothetical protein
MRNLIPSSLDPFTVFRDVVNAKRVVRRERLRKRLRTFRRYYDEYNNSTQQLETVRTRRHKAGQSEDLRHCYTVRTPPLNRLLADIRSKIPDIRSDKCPYCNIDKPGTFDHYLSMGRFPEYAVHALNLLPCCNSCNQIKGERLIYAVNRRRVVNLYFDRIPQRRYLHVEIDHDPTDAFSATYRLVRPAWVRRDTFQLLHDHFETLNLLSRYRQCSNATFSEVQKSMLAHQFSQRQVERFLSDEATMLFTEVSPNYWKAVLLDAMAADRTFVASCV